MIRANSGFARHQRLFRPGEFDRVLRSRDVRREKGPLRVLVKYTDLSHARLGVIIPKRWVRKAHDRNRCKRIIREYFRLCSDRLPAVDVVFMVIKPVNAGEFPELVGALLTSLCRP